jgi:hypothetical protein
LQHQLSGNQPLEEQKMAIAFNPYVVMITFRAVRNEIHIYIDGKLSGSIRRIEDGWAYFPKSDKEMHGEILDSIQAVKIRCLANYQNRKEETVK